MRHTADRVPLYCIREHPVTFFFFLHFLLLRVVVHVVRPFVTRSYNREVERAKSAAARSANDATRVETEIDMCHVALPKKERIKVVRW